MAVRRLQGGDICSKGLSFERRLSEVLDEWLSDAFKEVNDVLGSKLH